jgi:hypothetical protein
VSRRDFFICYADADLRRYVLPLQRALERNGYSTWVAEGEIKPGQNIVSKIGTAIRDSRYVVPIITSQSLHRSFPRGELELFIQRMFETGRECVIPICDADVVEVRSAFPLLAKTHLTAWNTGLSKIMEGIRAKLTEDRQVYESYMDAIESVPVIADIHIEVLQYGYGSSIVEIPGSKLRLLTPDTQLPPKAPAGARLKRHRVAKLFTAKELRSMWEDESVVVPREFVLVGRRTTRGNAVAAINCTDIFYFHDVDDRTEGLDFTLACTLGRGGISDFVDPTGTLHESHPALKGLPVGAIGALTVVEFENKRPIYRSPFIVLIRKGIRYPSDLWQSPKTGRPIVNTRARTITEARFLFQSRQDNGTGTDVFAADFDGSRMCSLSRKPFTASDGLRDRLGNFVGRWIDKQTAEIDVMRRGHHQLIRAKDCVARTKVRRRA